MGVTALEVAVLVVELGLLGWHWLRLFWWLQLGSPGRRGQW